MLYSIQHLEWKRSDETEYTDVTGAIEKGSVSATPHPDPDVDRPKGYSLTLKLTPDSTDFADALQDALLDIDPAYVTVHLEGLDVPIESLPVSVSKVPYPGDQNTAELGIPPDGHDLLHEHF
ncbi:MAG: hypothetical protein ABEL51_12195 [Salinibacter sp.]